jgi:hypothetical protein
VIPVVVLDDDNEIAGNRIEGGQHVVGQRDGSADVARLGDMDLVARQLGWEGAVVRDNPLVGLSGLALHQGLGLFDGPGSIRRTGNDTEFHLRFNLS